MTEQPRLIVQVDLSERFHRYVSALLSDYDCSKLDWIKLYESRTRKDWWIGYCRFPNPAKGQQYQITAAFPARWTYPKKMRIPTGSKTHGGSWKYTYTVVEMQDRDEAMLAVFGHELFHYLKRTRQLSTEDFGRNGNPAANKFAIHLIEDFRDTCFS